MAKLHKSETQIKAINLQWQISPRNHQEIIRYYINREFLICFKLIFSFISKLSLFTLLKHQIIFNRIRSQN